MCMFTGQRSGREKLTFSDMYTVSTMSEACTHTHMHACTYACTHTHTHSLAHTHTHTHRKENYKLQWKKYIVGADWQEWIYIVCLPDTLGQCNPLERGDISEGWLPSTIDYSLCCDLLFDDFVADLTPSFWTPSHSSLWSTGWRAASPGEWAEIIIIDYLWLPSCQSLDCVQRHKDRHSFYHTHTHTHEHTHPHTHEHMYAHSHARMHTHSFSLFLSLSHTHTHTHMNKWRLDRDMAE